MSAIFTVYAHAKNEYGNYDEPIDAVEVEAVDDREARRLGARKMGLRSQDWTLPEPAARVRLDVVEVLR